jgi:hypothetical protein
VKPETVIEKQVHENVEDSLKNIDTACAHGCKKNSHGAVQFLTGYKLHLDVSDTGFPLSPFVSGANVHDSQAIPLEKMTESKVFFCYSLMDAAYDCSVIDTFIRSRERVFRSLTLIIGEENRDLRLSLGKESGTKCGQK